jgi:hypothetical protein
MKMNMGERDRTVRIMVAMCTIGVILADMVPGVFKIILGVIAAIFLITSFVGVCPLYSIFGFRTNKNEDNVE